VPGRPIVQGTSANAERGGDEVQEALDDQVASGAQSRWLARTWILPYVLIATIVVADLLLPPSLSVGGFLVLAPLLAGRLTTGRDQVYLSGVVALAVGFVLGMYLHPIDASQLVLREILIVLGTMFALLNQGAYRRELSAFGRAAETITLAASLAAGVEPDQAYELVARSARTLYEADAVAVYRRQGDVLIALAEDRGASIPRLPGKLEPAAFPAALSDRPERVTGRSLSGPEAPMLEARGLGSMLWLPLIDAAGGQTGVILLAWRQRDPRLSASDLEASMRFAGLGARAIAGSERAQALAEVLHQIQALVLETPPSWASGYQIGVRYQSASALAEIGGDFYDVVEVGEEGVAFVIADARGKGVEASSLAAVLKGAYRTLVGEGASPAAILSRMDRLVARESGDEDFVTALAGHVYPNGRAVMASAGHPVPFGLGPPLAPTIAAPLGLGTRPTDAFGLLRRGQQLICYTDGLVEARNPAGEFIDLAALERAMAAGSLDEVLDQLVAAVERHSEGRRADDLALLGLEYAPRP
jgi:hypothetical protein